MIELDAKTKRGSRVETALDGRKGTIVTFDSPFTVSVEWDDGGFEYMVQRSALDNLDQPDSNCNIQHVSNSEAAVCCANCGHLNNKYGPCNSCFMHNKWKPQQTDC